MIQSKSHYMSLHGVQREIKDICDRIGTVFVYFISPTVKQVEKSIV